MSFSDLGCMFRHEDSPICQRKNVCINKLCQFKHSQSDKTEQDSCDKCGYIITSAEAFKTHLEDFHKTKSDQQIEDEQMFDLYVKTNFPEIFDYTFLVIFVITHQKAKF